jgi:hypothetical protein
MMTFRGLEIQEKIFLRTGKRENVGNDLSLIRERFSANNSNDHCHFVDVRHKFFSNRVTEHWNKLPNNVVNNDHWTVSRLALMI